MAEAELRQELMNTVDAQCKGKVIKEYITRFNDGFAQRRNTMTAVFPVAIAAFSVTQLIPARTKHPAAGGNFIHFQAGQTNEWLDGRAWRGLAAQCPVEQGMIGRPLQFVVGFLVNPVDKLVRVKAWCAHQCQHFAGFWINRHNRSAMSSQGPGGSTLQAGIECQIDTGSRCRPVAGQDTQNPALGIRFDLLEPYLAVQKRFIISLGTEFADVVGSAVGGSIACVCAADRENVFRQLH